MKPIFRGRLNETVKNCDARHPTWPLHGMNRAHYMTPEMPQDWRNMLNCSHARFTKILISNL